MKLEKIKIIIEIISYTSVVISLIFVGVGIQQNNEIRAEENRFRRLQIATETYTIIATNYQLSNVMSKHDNGEELNDPEMRQMNAMLTRVFKNIEWSYLTLPKDELDLKLWKLNYMNSLAWQQFWSVRKTIFNIDFVNFMDNYVFTNLEKEAFLE